MLPCLRCARSSSTGKSCASAATSGRAQAQHFPQERCIAKPETYEERKARREAEIEGLKEALRVLKDRSRASGQSQRAPRVSACFRLHRGHHMHATSAPPRRPGGRLVVIASQASGGQFREFLCGVDLEDHRGAA